MSQPRLIGPLPRRATPATSTATGHPRRIRPESLGADMETAELAARRFRREAEAAASLRSPHTVELYDFGVTEDHTLYFVMDLLEGMDLETLVERHGALPANRATHVLRQVCESLEEAHVGGLVRRDIKPANIHVGRVGLRHDFVKVVDFGLVKSVAGPSEDCLATAAGLTPGTPAYMAPELILTCLAKHPGQRPDAGTLGRALAAIPVEPWTEDDAAQWWRSAVAAPVPVG